MIINNITKGDFTVFNFCYENYVNQLFYKIAVLSEYIIMNK